MTAAELRELARECADTAMERAFTETDVVLDEEYEDMVEACVRLENAAAILDGAQ